MNFKLASLLSTLAFSALGAAAVASDHREAPLIKQDSAADLADVYAFLSPTNSNNLVVALTVNPFSVPSESTTFSFSSTARYRINIDTDGDAIADKFVTAMFRGTGNNQRLSVTLPDGSLVSGNVTPATLEPVANAPIVVSSPSGAQVFAGPRDDPFFFDVVGFNRFLSGTGSFNGTDGFAGYNVSALVVEFPMSMLGAGSSNIQVWAETARRKVTLRLSDTGKLEQNFGTFQQIDRVGAPAINTALIPAGLKDFYNIGQPALDGTAFAPAIVASLTSLGTDATNIGILASVAVPDTLKLDLNQPTAFPNGRGLADDVIDTVLFFIFNQVSVPDGVAGNDAPFLASFPYLATPHQPL